MLRLQQTATDHELRAVLGLRLRAPVASSVSNADTVIKLTEASRDDDDRRPP
jgi:hypothetical protein